MDVRHIICAKKHIKSFGSWATGTMPRTAFPLSKAAGKAYRLGSRRWRVMTFDALGMSCRLLINYSYELSQYQAILGVESGGDMKVLASLEFHPTHKPWHAHVSCEAIEDLPSGFKRGPWVKSLSARGLKHRTAVPATDDAAFARAASFFRLDRHEEGGLL